MALFESGAILIYLAEKSQRFLPMELTARYETLQWLMFQMGGVGPMFGQLGFSHKFAGKEYADKRPRDRYVAETRRLLSVLNARLGCHDWVAGGEYSIADIAIFPWVRVLLGFYEAAEILQIDDFSHVLRAMEEFSHRPAVLRALNIPRRVP